MHGQGAGILSNAKEQLGPKGSILDLHKEDKDQTSFFLSENFTIILKNSIFVAKFQLHAK